MRATLAICLFALLAGCASLSEDTCRTGDWYAVGVRDGADGRESDYIERHVAACGDYGIRPDWRRWEAGRRAGLPLYCTTENAFVINARGGNLNPVCPAEDRAVLGEASFLGDQAFRIGTLIDDARDDLRDARQIYEDTTLDPALRSRAFLRQQRLSSEIRRLERERLQLERASRLLGPAPSSLGRGGLPRRERM